MSSGLNAGAIALLVARKDLRSELRTRTGVQAAVFYAALAVLLFGLAVDTDSATLRRLAPGVLWLALALASLLAVGRSFAAEHEEGTLDALLLYPAPRGSILAGKVIAAFVLMLAVSAAALGAMSVLYALPAPQAPGLLALAVALGALAMAAVGVFYGAVCANLRAREALMPMLLLPLLVPVVIATTEATAAAFDGGAGLRWAGLLAFFDLLVLALAAAVFPWVVDE